MRRFFACVMMLFTMTYSVQADRLASQPWVQGRLSDLALAVGAVRDEDAARAARLQGEVEKLEELAREFTIKVNAAQAAYMSTQSALMRVAASLDELPVEQQEALAATLAATVTNMAQQIEDTLAYQEQRMQTQVTASLDSNRQIVLTNMLAAVASTQLRWVDKAAPARDREVRWIASFDEIPPTGTEDERLCEQRMFILTNSTTVAFPPAWNRTNGYITDGSAILTPGTNLIMHTGLGGGCTLVQVRNLGDL